MSFYNAGCPPSRVAGMTLKLVHVGIIFRAPDVRGRGQYTFAANGPPFLSINNPYQGSPARNDRMGQARFMRLNTHPARSPVNASHAASRQPSHDSEPAWFAAPSVYETFTRYTLPASPGASGLSSRTSADFSQVSLDI
jgi:hypothetical protein